MKQILEVPIIWQSFRWLLDIFFGAYRKRRALIKEWGGCSGSILDVGCGIGQFSDISPHYIGIDMDSGYIARARKLYPDKEFKCADAAELPVDNHFDTVLLIGILHHMDEESCRKLLTRLKSIASNLVMMEVIQEQTNPFGRWIKNNDRGEFVRTQLNVTEMIRSTGFELEDEKVLYLGPTRTIAQLWH